MRDAHVVRSAVAAAALLVAAACGGDDSEPSRAASPTATEASVPTTPPADLPAEVSVDDVGAQELPGGDGDWAMAAGGAVWVTGIGPGLVAYDGRTGKRVAAVRAGIVGLAMEEAGGDVWACAADGQLIHVDGPTRHVASRTELGVTPLQESSITAGGGELFVPTLEPASTIVVADARTGRKVREIPAPENTSGLRYGFGSLWAAVAPDQLVRLDPRTGDVQKSYPVGLTPVFVSVGADAVWVMNQSDGSVSGVSPDTGEVTTVTVDTGPIQGGDIVATTRSVWVRVTDVLVARVDVATGEVTTRIGPASGSGSVAVSGANLWITAHDVHTLWRVPGQD